MAVQPVGVTDRHGRRHGRPQQFPGAPVAHGVARFETLDLHDAGFERRNRAQARIVLPAEAVKPQPEAAHVEPRLGEPLDGRRIGRMTDDGIGQRRGYGGTHAVVARDLLPGVGILFGHVGAVQVRKDRRHLHGGQCRQHLAQPPDLLLHESQPVHARIELDVNRIAGFARMRHRIGEIGERTETVYLGFEAVGDHLVETVGVGIQHHDGHRDPPLAQQHALVGERHGEVVDALMLEHLRHLEIPRAVRTRLDHRHEPGPKVELRAEIVQVVDHGVEIDLQHRRVALARQRMREFLETVLPRAFQQDGTPGHGPAADAGDALVGRGVKLPVAAEQRGVTLQFGTDADERVDACPRDHSRHAAVKFVVGQPALRDVRQHERPAARQRHVVQVVERQGQRVEIEVVGVVDQHRVVDAVLDFETHGDLGSFGKRRRGIAHRRAERLDDPGVAA